jgi:hypothetical protein
MDKISPLGWAAILFIILIAASVNLWMIALLRNRDPEALNRAIRPNKNAAASHQNMQKFVETLRDPFGEERKNLQELSTRIKELKEPPDQST